MTSDRALTSESDEDDEDDEDDATTRRLDDSTTRSRVRRRASAARWCFAGTVRAQTSHTYVSS